MISRVGGKAFDGNTLVASVNASDPNYAGGWTAIGTAVNDNEALGLARTLHAASFDDVSSVVPEPSTIGLLAMGMLLTWKWQRTRRLK